MLVEVDDLQNYMDITFDNRQKKAAEMILEGLQSELESHLRRPVEITEFTETYRLQMGGEPLPMGAMSLYSGDGSGGTLAPDVLSPARLLTPPITVYLRNTPVLGISEVSLSSPTSASAVVESVDYVSQRYGIDLFTAWANDEVTITYTAGLDGANNRVLKLLILRAASREAQNLHDDVVGLKELNARDVAPMTTGFTPEELKSVDRFRHQRI